VSGRDIGSHDSGGRCRQFPQGGVEDYDLTPPRLTIEQRALTDVAVEHLFKAEGLGAQLNVVCAMGFGPSALVLYRERADRPTLQLDHIRLSDDTQTDGSQSHAASDSNTRSAFALSGIDTVVKQSAFGGCDVFGPELLDVYEGTLTGAEQMVLKRRQGDEGSLGNRVGDRLHPPRS